MDYIKLIEKTIEYIEDNLEDKLTLNELAERCNLSKYYFHRIFSAVMGWTLIEYITQRRLNKSISYILNTSQSIAEIAYRLQFGSQTSFARSFKKRYGLTPGRVRKKALKMHPTPLPQVVRRVMKNFKSDVITDFTFVEQKSKTLAGFYMDINLSDKDIQYKVNNRAKDFLNSVKPDKEFSSFAIYFNNIEEIKKGFIRVFFGIDFNTTNYHVNCETYELSNMLYARFKYTGDLLHIGDLVVKDLHRWLKISKIEIPQSEVLFIQAYDKVYKENNLSDIFLPIQVIPQGV